MEPQPGPSGVLLSNGHSGLRTSQQPSTSSSSQNIDQVDNDGQKLSKKSRLSQTIIEPIDELPGSQVKSKIFAGLSFAVFGYTEPCCEDLMVMIEEHGGVYDHMYSKSRTSYMIASNVPYAKIREVGETKILKPDWIVDCIKENKLLPCDYYYLYGAKRRKIGQTTLSQYASNNSTIINSPNSTSPLSSELSRQTITVKPELISPATNNQIQEEDQLDIDQVWNLPSSPSLLDLKSLMGLPEIIRNEVIANYEAKAAPQPQPLSRIAMRNAAKQTNGATRSSNSNQTAKTKKKNSKPTQKAAALGPMDFFVVRTGSVTTNGTTSASAATNNRVSQANICGETNLDSVTSLVREWVQSEPELIDEDVAYILKYFFDLIEERSFIILAAVIQSYYEAVTQRGSNEWKEAYNNVIMSITCELRSDSLVPQDLILPTFDIH